MSWLKRLWPRRGEQSPSVQQILLPNIEMPPGADFPWEEWREKYRALRNRVVHDAYEPTSQEAQDSFDNVSSLCRFLESLELHTKETE